MAVSDLVYKSSLNEVIYDPVTVTSSSSIDFIITNLGSDDLTDLGIYIVPTTTIGDVDYPSDNPPETDYQDLIKWGEQTELSLAITGGLRITVPQTTGPDLTRYITRQAGSTLANKIPLADLASQASVTITLLMQTPPSVLTRRMHISLKVE